MQYCFIQEMATMFFSIMAPQDDGYNIQEQREVW